MKASRLYLKLNNQSLYNLHARSFSKWHKGASGKENTMGSHFEFPRHKELFNQHYYEDNANDFDETSANNIESPFSDHLKNKQPLAGHDDKMDVEGLDVHGGILNNYRKVSGHSVEDMLEGDYWRHKKDIAFKASKMFTHVQ